MKQKLLLFLYLSLIVFFGIFCCNLMAITLQCLFSDFGHFFDSLLSLPYPAYGLVALAIAGILTLLICKQH